MLRPTEKYCIKQVTIKYPENNTQSYDMCVNMEWLS